MQQLVISEIGVASSGQKYMKCSSRKFDFDSHPAAISLFGESFYKVDWRKDIIRVAPVPLYNTYTEVYNFVKLLKEAWVESKTNAA